jgi:acetamidase/formamidase
MIPMRSIAALISLAAAPAFAQADREIAGEWDVTATSPNGTAGARLVLSVADGRASGTSGPLDANQYWPLEVAGAGEAGGLILTFKSDGEPVGTVRVVRSGDRLDGEGSLYGTPVRLTGRRSAAPLRRGRTHLFRPSQYQLHFSSRIPAALTIAPGDTVITSTVDNEGRDSAGTWRAMPGNPLTGPFHVEGAMPGDTLVVRLIRIELDRDSAHMYGRQLNSRAIPSGYPQTPDPVADRAWRLDREAGVARLSRPGERLAGFTVPLRPMIGSIGVAPPGNQSLSAGDIGFHGGNLDYNRLTSGTILYLPVFQPGALLSLGDGHAAQGDGEISGQGLETSTEVTFRVDLIRGKAPRQPWAEDDRFVMISGIDNSLDEALKMATANAAIWLKDRYGLNDSEAATFLSASIAYEVASIVGGRPHVVARLDKAALRQIGAKVDRAAD